MTWVKDKNSNILEQLAINVIKCGKIPNHVAFVMDGNRRFAKKNNVEKSEGHSKGFDKLAETLKWSLELGITEVTMYAFSIENFKRTENEVATLLDLAREKFRKLIEEEENLNRHGVKVRVIGNITLLPEDIQQLIAKAMLITVNNSKLRLNVAFSYTGQDEILSATREILKGLSTGILEIGEVTPSLIHASLYSEDSPAPELFIRTSGEMRLSDFLPWQCSNSLIYFSSVLWPDFSLWHFLLAIMKYQRDYPSLKSWTQVPTPSHNNEFLTSLYSTRLETLKKLVDNSKTLEQEKVM